MKIPVRTLFGTLLLAPISFVLAAGHVIAQLPGYSTTSINMTEFSFTPSTIDSTNSSQTITMTVRITDSERDFYAMSGRFTGLWGSYGFGFDAGDRISGNARDGVYRKNLTFSQYTRAGTWVVSYIFVWDGSSTYPRWREFDTYYLASRGFPTQLQVTNNNEADPPEISDFSFTPSVLGTVNGTRKVTFTVRARDQGSGIASLYGSISYPFDCYVYDDDCVDVGFSFASTDRISGDKRDGVYRTVVNFPLNIPAATYGISLYASDAVNNHTDISYGSLAAEGYPSTLQITGAVSGSKMLFDFDRDGKSDVSVWRESDGVWLVANSSNQPSQPYQWGTVGDRIVPGDYDGDGQTDYAVWRPSTGTWYVDWFSSYQFGLPTDLPVQGDFDGDGKTDIAVFRPSTGIWYLQQSTAGFAAMQFGANGDKPVVGDYDGDGRSDIAVYRPSEGIWYELRSTQGFAAIQFGISTDKVVPADFDGDGKTDLGVYRDSTGIWYLQQSTAGFSGIQFGMTNDIPVAADFDGDGKADVSVYRPSNATWYRINSSNSAFSGIQFGQNGDKPVPSAAVPVQ